MARAIKEQKDEQSMNTDIEADNNGEKELTLEEKFDKIEAIVKKLEQSDVTLEQSFGLYTEGLALVNQCNNDIVGIEEKVKLLSDDGHTEDFE